MNQFQPFQVNNNMHAISDMQGQIQSVALNSTCLNNAFLLNWEDVLAPMSLLQQHMQIRPSREVLHQIHIHIQQNSYLQQAFYALEDQIIKLLAKASVIGPVYIVTESAKYMEAVCESIFPRLRHWVIDAGTRARQMAQHNVEIVGAPRKFTNVADHAAWRLNVLQQICKLSLPELRSVTLGKSFRQVQLNNQKVKERLGVVVITATDLDMFACTNVMKNLPAFVPKHIRVQTAVTQAFGLEAFFAQLQTLEQYIATAAACNSSFTTNL